MRKILKGRAFSKLQDNSPVFKKSTNNLNVVCKNISKHFGDVVALNGLSFKVFNNEYLCVVGPSGSGKTTLLRIIAGLEKPTDGEIYIRDKNVLDISVKDRNVGMVFQNYALFPHLTVYDNIAIGLKIKHLPKNEIFERTHNVANLLSIKHLLKRKPRQLSGGEQQRVALCRAIIKDPDLFLLDEPLANLDADLKNNMRSELKRLHREIGKTFIHVTHDQFEAFSIAEKILLINKGEVKDFGSPEKVYSNPQNIYSAKFIGFPKMSFVDVVAVSSSNKIEFRRDNFYLTINYNNKEIEKPSIIGNSEITLGFRPEALSSIDSKNLLRIGRGEIVNREMFGPFVVYSVNIGGNQYNIIDKHNSFYQIGGMMDVYVNPSRINYFHKITTNNLFCERILDVPMR